MKSTVVAGLVVATFFGVQNVNAEDSGRHAYSNEAERARREAQQEKVRHAYSSVAEKNAASHQNSGEGPNLGGRFSGEGPNLGGRFAPYKNLGAPDIPFSNPQKTEYSEALGGGKDAKTGIAAYDSPTFKPKTKLPSGFRLPIYPGSMIRDVKKVGHDTEVDLTSADLPPKIVDWYMKALPLQGWRLWPVADVTESGGKVRGIAQAGTFVIDAKQRPLISEIRITLTQ